MNVCGRQAVTRVRSEERVSRLRPTHEATHKQTEAARQQREDASSGSQAQCEGREQRGHGCPQPPHIGHNLRGKPGSAHAPSRSAHESGGRTCCSITSSVLIHRAASTNGVAR